MYITLYQHMVIKKGGFISPKKWMHHKNFYSSRKSSDQDNGGGQGKIIFKHHKYWRGINKIHGISREHRIWKDSRVLGFPLSSQTACHRCRRYAEGKWRKRRAIQTAAMRVESFFPKSFRKTEIPCTNDQQRHRNDEGIQTKGRPRPEDWLGEPNGEGEKE